MIVEGNFIQPITPRFDGHYDYWSMLMKNFLHSKKYQELMETGYDAPRSELQSKAQQKINEEMKLKDLKVKNHLFRAIDRIILYTILKKDTSKAIWDAMKKI